jgi:Cu+-exporting ATPase
MDVERSDAAGRADYEGQTYYFCSADCQTQFEETPDRFSKEVFAG